MNSHSKRFQGLGLAIAGTFLASSALAQEAERYDCLQFNQVEAIHELGESQMLLEVEGGTTLYLITVEDRCFRGDSRGDIRIEGKGQDSCIRTTDRVHFGRRECRIEDFSLIETQEQLDAVLNGHFE